MYLILFQATEQSIFDSCKVSFLNHKKENNSYCIEHEKIPVSLNWYQEPYVPMPCWQIYLLAEWSHQFRLFLVGLTQELLHTNGVSNAPTE